MLTQNDFPNNKIWLLKPILEALAFLIITTFFAKYDIYSGGSNQYAVLLLAFFVLILTLKPIIISYTLKFELLEDRLTLQQGLFNRKQGSFFYKNIQNVTINQGFIDRILGVYCVTVENAVRNNQRANWIYTTFLVGLYDNRITIPGLTFNKAQALQQALLSKSKKASLS